MTKKKKSVKRRESVEPAALMGSSGTRHATWCKAAWQKGSSRAAPWRIHLYGQRNTKTTHALKLNTST